MKTVLLDLITSKKFVATLVAITVASVGKLGVDVDPDLLSKIYYALLLYVASQGVADLGKSAAQTKALSDQATSGDPKTQAPAQIALQRMAARVPTSLLVLGIGLALMQVTCTAETAKPPLAAGVVATLDCQSAHIDADVLADARLFADAKVASWIAGGARPSSAKIRADLALIRSDLGRCAIAGALAAIAVLTAPPVTPPANAPATPATIDVARSTGPSRAQASDQDLRAAFISAARELGWPHVKTRDGAVL